MLRISLFEDALPDPLFLRLVRAVRRTGRERLKANGSYTTTFWYPRGTIPGNVVEESIEELYGLVDPGPRCIGMEWWLGRLSYGKKLRFHFDRDLALKRRTGKSVHPLWSSVLYLNAFPSSPTVILDQVLGADGKSKLPPKPEFGKAVPPVPNHYLVFPGNLRHGVVPTSNQQNPDGSEGRPVGLRLSLLVNYWHRRPLPPVCSDYDGSIYPHLRDEGIEVRASAGKENPMPAYNEAPARNA